jgi:cell division initiation protein
MKVTPLEIRQKTFEKNFRGYEKDEVNAFLLTLSQEWERMMDENKELRIKLEATEREVNKLREVETSLFKTLKTAEDTGASVIDQAKKAADLHLRESQFKAEAMLSEAKLKAKDTIEESEMRAKQLVADMEERVKALVENYKKLESTREDLLGDLKHLASEVIDRVERSRQHTKDFNPDQYLTMAKREAKKIAFPNMDFERNTRPENKVEEPRIQEQKITEPKIQESKAIEKEPEYEHEEVAEIIETQPAKKVQKSFFDEIG